MELTSKNVDELMMDCLFGDDTPENRARAVVVEGITTKFGFDPDKLAKHRDDITSMLFQLPEQFLQSKGGGWSFLQACNRADGVQWTGLHKVMECLLMLGLAIGRVKCCMPREFWRVLPGGVPYYVVLDAEREPFKTLTVKVG